MLIFSALELPWSFRIFQKMLHKFQWVNIGLCSLFYKFEVRINLNKPWAKMTKVRVEGHFALQL
jgi:hypothetical protein